MFGHDIPLDTDNEDQLGLVINVEVTLLAGSAGQADLLTLSIAVLLDVGLSALEDDTTLLLVGLLNLELAGDSKRCWCEINSGGIQRCQPRKMVNNPTTSTRRSSRVVGSYHQIVGKGVGMLEDKETDLLLLLGLSAALSASSLLGLALLQEGLRDHDLVLGGDGAVGG